MTYRGSEKFKTIPGAITSLIVVIILTAFGCYKAYVLFNYVNPNISKAGYIRSLDTAEPYSP